MPSWIHCGSSRCRRPQSLEIVPRFDFTAAGEFYSGVDVMVVPSMWPESFGLVAREAALLGLWVVAADAGGLHGAVAEGDSGHTFPMGDLQRLRDILLELDRDADRYRQPVPEAVVAGLGIAAVAQNVDLTCRLYDEILAPKSVAGAGGRPGGAG